MSDVIITKTIENSSILETVISLIPFFIKLLEVLFYLKIFIK